MKRYILLLFTVMLTFITCKQKKASKKLIEPPKQEIPFVWNNATLYFLLTDRFNNGDPSNDINFNRTEKTGKYRGFMGGDLKGVIQKIKDGYFTKLGVNVLWLTPIFEQVHGDVNEGSGLTYGYHGYWTKDWTALDPNFGTKADLKALVSIAHQNDIRILLDAVVNHTGPVTAIDPVWPKDWVRTEPVCKHQDYESSVPCALVKNLPDILTEKNSNVNLPKQLIEKWDKEGRLKEEQDELEAFFKETGYPKAPRFYIMKWLADYIAEYGIDGYRVDTAKHVEENVWQEFREICNRSYRTYKKEHLDSYLEDEFYLVGEVYGYGIEGGLYYDYSDKKVNYFDKAFNSLINFDFRWQAKEWKTYDELFTLYSDKLHTDLKGYGVLNYISSHDDGHPFDAERKRNFEGANKLLLSPGTVQIYYGDEVARELIVPETVGDANLRSPMQWNFNQASKDLLTHYQKLGQFRKKHPSIGAGTHKKLSDQPYLFSRTFKQDDFVDGVVIGLDLPEGKKELNVSAVYDEGTKIHDFYSNQTVVVTNGIIRISSPYTIVLLEKISS